MSWRCLSFSETFHLGTESTQLMVRREVFFRRARHRPDEHEPLGLVPPTGTHQRVPQRGNGWSLSPVRFKLGTMSSVRSGLTKRHGTSSWMWRGRKRRAAIAFKVYSCATLSVTALVPAWERLRSQRIARSTPIASWRHSAAIRRSGGVSISSSKTWTGACCSP